MRIRTEVAPIYSDPVELSANGVFSLTSQGNTEGGGDSMNISFCAGE